MRRPGKGETVTEKQIEQIRRRREQLLRVGHALSRSGYRHLDTLIKQVADDIEALISAAEKK